METTILSVIQGDITRVEVDAIVNAANSSLLGGGGVDGAIHRAGGPEILEECRMIVASQGGCKTGEAVITTAGKLPAKFIVHTVGPVWNGGRKGEREKLADCYRNALIVATENGCKTVAFPSISTGVYGFPKKDAAEIAVKTVREYVEQQEAEFAEVIFVCFDEENLGYISANLKQLI